MVGCSAPARGSAPDASSVFARAQRTPQRLAMRTLPAAATTTRRCSEAVGGACDAAPTPGQSGSEQSSALAASSAGCGAHAQHVEEGAQGDWVTARSAAHRSTHTARRGSDAGDVSRACTRKLLVRPLGPRRAEQVHPTGAASCFASNCHRCAHAALRCCGALHGGMKQAAEAASVPGQRGGAQRGERPLRQLQPWRRTEGLSKRNQRASEKMRALNGRSAPRAPTKFRGKL